MAATKDTEVFASGSDSHRSEMTAVLRRLEPFFLEGFESSSPLSSLSSLSSSSSPIMARFEEEEEGQREPPV
jgi:hypothetical protein